MSTQSKTCGQQGCVSWRRTSWIVRASTVREKDKVPVMIPEGELKCKIASCVTSATYIHSSSDSQMLGVSTQTDVRQSLSLDSGSFSQEGRPLSRLLGNSSSCQDGNSLNTKRSFNAHKATVTACSGWQNMSYQTDRLLQPRSALKACQSPEKSLESCP